MKSRKNDPLRFASKSLFFGGSCGCGAIGWVVVASNDKLFVFVTSVDIDVVSDGCSSICIFDCCSFSVDNVVVVVDEGIDDGIDEGIVETVAIFVEEIGATNGMIGSVNNWNAVLRFFVFLLWIF